MHPGDLAGGFSDLEMTWLLYCAAPPLLQSYRISGNSAKYVLLAYYVFQGHSRSLMSLSIERQYATSY